MQDFFHRTVCLLEVFGKFIILQYESYHSINDHEFHHFRSDSCLCVVPNFPKWLISHCHLSLLDGIDVKVLVSLPKTSFLCSNYYSDLNKTCSTPQMVACTSFEGVTSFATLGPRDPINSMPSGPSKHLWVGWWNIIGQNHSQMLWVLSSGYWSEVAATGTGRGGGWKNGKMVPGQMLFFLAGSSCVLDWYRLLITNYCICKYIIYWSMLMHIDDLPFLINMHCEMNMF